MTPTYVITKHVDGGWNIIDHSGDPPTLQGGDRLVPESYATQLEEALERLLRNAERIFDKQPVRDWDETLHEARAALSRGTERKGHHPAEVAP